MTDSGSGASGAGARDTSPTKIYEYAQHYIEIRDFTHRTDLLNVLIARTINNIMTEDKLHIIECRTKRYGTAIEYRLLTETLIEIKVGLAPYERKMWIHVSMPTDLVDMEHFPQRYAKLILDEYMNIIKGGEE